ncbi:BrnT family toxin [Treponema sp. R6D11]
MSFEDAKFVFNDPYKVILPDLYHSDEEEHWLAIGMVNRVLFVVFTERGDSVIRIISARIGTKAEEKLYNENNS